MHYKAIWISDVHLGTSGCQANYLLDFLKHNEADKFYLVGDIIDGWHIKRGWYWPQSHNDVVQKILRKVRKGVKVTFVPGNHDESARQFFGMSFGDIKVMDEVIHTTVDGKKLWVKENTPDSKLILAKRENKRDYANRKSILIDDRTDNINDWNAAGGIGILFTSTNQTIDKLKELGL